MLLVCGFDALLYCVSHAQHLHRKFDGEGLVLVQQIKIEFDLRWLLHLLDIEAAFDPMGAAGLLREQQ